MDNTLTENAKSWTDIINSKLSNFNLGNILSALLVLLFCIIIIRIIMKIAEGVIDKTHINNTISGFLKTAIRVVLYFIAVIIAADMIGIPVTSLLAVFSVAGLAVSLSVQNSLSNIAGSFTILATKPFVEGDYIETADISGTVKEIGLFYTKIITPDNKLVNITNAEISQSKIINYTAEGIRRVDVSVTAAYSASISDVEKALLKSALSAEKILSDQEVFASVSGYGNNAVSYTLKAWARQEDYWDVYFNILRNIDKEFKAADIEMTYDHLNVHMINN